MPDFFSPDLRRKTGSLVALSIDGQQVASFVPAPLPPVDPRLETGRLDELLHAASSGLDRVEAAGSVAASLPWLDHALVVREAHASCQISGLETSLEDVFAATSEPAASRSPAQSVLELAEALVWARDQLASDRGLTLSRRLLDETQRRLVGIPGTAGGQARREPVWIGAPHPSHALYVPPPPDRIEPLLRELDRYLQAEDSLPDLIRIGLIHVQLDTILPYRDGNGRLARALTSLLLEHWGLTAAWILPWSEELAENRTEYRDRLLLVRRRGDWEGWLEFFLRSLRISTEKILTTAQDLVECVQSDRDRLLAAETTSASSLRLFETLLSQPFVTVGSAAKRLSTSKPTASKAVDLLVQAGILTEATGRKKDRIFRYDGFLDALTGAPVTESRPR